MSKPGANKTFVVLYWVDENKVSIEELNKVNEEDRYVGAPTTMKFGQKFHKAVVRLISSKYHLCLTIFFPILNSCCLDTF
jgi:hypothetical protein